MTRYSPGLSGGGWEVTAAPSSRLRLLAAAQYLRHLRQDRDRDLGRPDRADREADRAVDAGEVGIGEADLPEAVNAPCVRALRAERADIEALRAQRDRKRRIIELRIVRQRNDRRAVIGLQPFQCLVGPFGREF